MHWTKAAGDRWTCQVPGARFVIKIGPKGDGRWTWEVTAAGAVSPMASGVATSLAGAKNVAEVFLKRAT